MIIGGIDLSEYIECERCGSVFKYSSVHRDKKKYCDSCIKEKYKENLAKYAKIRRDSRLKVKNKLKNNMKPIDEIVNKYYYSSYYLMELSGFKSQELRNKLIRDNIENRIYRNFYVEGKSGIIYNRNICFYDIRFILTALKETINSKNLSQDSRANYIQLLDKLEKVKKIKDKEWDNQHKV